MKRQFRDAWVEDLKQNEHRKCVGMLKDYDGNYCALGRACVVADIDIVSDLCYQQLHFLGIDIMAVYRLSDSHPDYKAVIEYLENDVIVED